MIVPPVLACFTDQDARVRYYACESMYNIAKVAKGEVLPYFNDIFDALCKVRANDGNIPLKTNEDMQLGADSELSVKNGAELLDRLVKDIVSESAATYVSVLEPSAKDDEYSKEADDAEGSIELPTAFSLAKFIPLLKERIHVLNPFTRTFLVGWITLLDSIPDLELVSYLPEFLDGLFKFLSDPNRDVHIATQGALERFLQEIKRISRIKKGIAETRRSRSDDKSKRRGSINSGSLSEEGEADNNSTIGNEDEDEDKMSNSSDDWVPGQDVHVEYKAIMEILTANLDKTAGKFV